LSLGSCMVHAKDSLASAADVTLVVREALSVSQVK
jgi:cellobiose-specific phosphotransferase system component IIA